MCHRLGLRRIIISLCVVANDRISHATSNFLQGYLEFYHTRFFLKIILSNYEVLEKIVYLCQK